MTQNSLGSALMQDVKTYIPSFTAFTVGDVSVDTGSTVHQLLIESGLLKQGLTAVCLSSRYVNPTVFLKLKLW